MGSTGTIDFLESLVRDNVTGTLLFESGCDPVGSNPLGDQIFAVRSDGSGLRQLTATRGMTIDPDRTVLVSCRNPELRSFDCQFYCASPSGAFVE